MGTSCTLLLCLPHPLPEFVLGQREVATGHQGSVTAAGDPQAPIAGGWVPGGTVQPQQEGAGGVAGVHARLGVPTPCSYTHRPKTRTRAGTHPHAVICTLRATQRAPQTPDTPPPAQVRAPPGRERAQAPAPLRPAMPALASPSCLPTAADETCACPQRTSTQAHAHRGRGQGHGRGFLPPGLGGLQGASYFQEPSLPGEGGLAWRACHRAHNTSLALGSPSSGPRPDMAATSRAGSARAGLSPVISSSSHSPARQGLLFPAFYRKGTRGAEVW